MRRITLNICLVRRDSRVTLKTFCGTSCNSENVVCTSYNSDNIFWYVVYDAFTLRIRTYVRTYIRIPGLNTYWYSVTVSVHTVEVGFAGWFRGS